MSGIVWQGRYRLGETVVWEAGKSRRSGVVQSYRQERDGSYTLFVRTDGGPVTVWDGQVVCADGDGLPGPAGAVAGVDAAEARALARAILAGHGVRWPVQQQLRTLALAVLGEPVPAPEPAPTPAGEAVASC